MTGKERQHAQRDEALVSAWLKAARKLGLEVDRDVETVARDGQVVVWPLRIRGFGRANGVVICLRENVSDIARRHGAADAAGMAASFLSPEYQTYNRELFKSTLDDLGWHGTGPAPAWYTGAAWTRADKQ